MKSWKLLWAMTAAATLLGCGGDDEGKGKGKGKGGSAGTASGGSGGAGAVAGAAGGGMAGTAGMASGGAAGMAGGAGGAGGSGDAGISCTTCLQTECAAELGACTANADCSAIVTCGAGCGSPPDAQCVMDCYDNNPSGQADFDAVATCTQTKCANCTLP